MQLTPEQKKARERRNRAIALALVAFAVLVFVVTLLNLKRNLDERARLAPPAAEAGR